MNDIFDPDYCWVVAEYERLLTVNGGEARSFLVAKYREGYRSERSLQLLMDIADPDVKNPRGRRRGSHLDWGDIGRAFRDMRRSGVPVGKAQEALAQEYGIEERTIGTRVKEFRDAMADADNCIKEWQQEFDSWSADEQRHFFEEGAALCEATHTDIPPAERDARRALAEAWEAEQAEARQRCPHDCTNGCRRAHMLKDRHLCPFSHSLRNKTSI